MSNADFTRAAEGGSFFREGGNTLLRKPLFQAIFVVHCSNCNLQ